MLESLSRREQFRQVWGVSPKSINQKRNLKTLIGAHQISFTETEPTLTNVNKIDEEMFDNEMFERENIEQENNDSQDVDVEGILPTLALDFSIPSELFSQYIDANFPSNEDDDSTESTQFQSIEEVFASRTVKTDVSGRTACSATTTSGLDTCSDAASSVSSEGAGKLQKIALLPFFYPPSSGIASCVRMAGAVT